MSEIQQAPDWWQATDGKWYPPQPTTPPPAPTDSGKTKRPLWKKKRFLIPVVLLAIIVGAAIAGGGTEGGSEDSDTSVAADGNVDTDEIVEDVVDTVEEAELGTQENPYKFGEPHSRDAGVLGAAWTVSIDDVRELPKNSFLADEDDPRICLGIIVTVTLDSLSGDELVSNPFSMPDINMIDLDGQKAEDGFAECDATGLVAESITNKFGVEVAEGGTATYVDPVLIDSTDYSFVAVESTVYEK